MSISTLSGREGVVLTDPKFLPFTMGMTKWVNTMAGRKDLSVRVLSKTSGAPARFLHARASVDINEKMLAGLDPAIVGSQEFVALYPAKAGLMVHETAGHARNSYLLNLDTIMRKYGNHHTNVFKLLEEGRCERQGQPYMTRVELFALRSAVLDILLDDLREETADEQVANSPGTLILHTLGLVAARADGGILDVTQPKAAKVLDGLETGMGVRWYKTFTDLAVEFSKQKVGPWDSDEPTMHELTKEWVKAEEEFLDKVKQPNDTTTCTFPGIPPTGTGKGEEGEQGEQEGEPTEGTSTGGSKSKPGEGEPESGTGSGKDQTETEQDPAGESGTEPSESGDEQDGEQGDGDGGASESDSPGTEDQDGKGGEQPGEDDEGTPGDGSFVLTQDMTDGSEGEASLGEYAGGTSLEDAYRELLKDLGVASEEAHNVGGHRLGIELKAIHKANALEHKDRRERNKAAAKLWR